MARSEQVFTSHALAEHLHCSQSALRNWIARGDAPKSFRLGDPHTGHHRFKQSAVDEWLADSPLYAEEGDVAVLLRTLPADLRQRRLNDPASVPPHTLNARGKAFYPIYKLDDWAIGWITSAEAGKRLGVAQSTMARWRSKDIGPKWVRVKNTGRVWYLAGSVASHAADGVHA